MKNRFLKIGDTKICYFDEGKGKPLVFLHGWVVSKESFSLLIEELKKGRRIIALDLPGCGESEELLKKHNFENYLEVFEKFIEKLKIEKFDAMASSFGATIILLYSLNKKNDLDKMIFHAPYYTPEQLPKKVRNCFVRWFLRILFYPNFSKKLYKAYFRRYALEERIPRIRSLTPKYLRERSKKIIEIILSKYDKMSCRALVEFPLGALNYDLRSDLKEIKNKTLILWGSKDVSLDKEFGKMMQKLMPNAKYEEIKNASHDVIIERPLEIASEIKKFLSEKD